MLGRMPGPSAPSTKATRLRPKRVLQVRVGASPARPIRQKPASPISSSARARLTTRAHGTRSSAPDAALASAPLSGGRMAVLGDDPDRPERRRRAQDRADIMRVGDLVEDQQDRALAGASARISPSQTSSSGSTSITTPWCGASLGTSRPRSGASARVTGDVVRKLHEGRGVARRPGLQHLAVGIVERRARPRAGPTIAAGSGLPLLVLASCAPC